jgi:deoxycytidylate deaminase
MINKSDLDFFLFDHLIQIAKNSTCHRSKCGSIIVSNNKIIGQGYNSQPCNFDGKCFKDELDLNFKSDKTCCIHAEQRAIVDALKNSPNDILDSSLYFIRLDENNMPKPSGDPYCTICSKMSLDVGIKWFNLWHKDGWVAYDTNYYNMLSFKIIEKNGESKIS